jgi:CARDB protein
VTGPQQRLLHSRRLRFAAIGILATAALTVGTADAATPSEGSLTDTGSAVTWTGGPFATDNASALLLSPPQCDATLNPCDDFTLHVATPAGYGADHSLTVDVSWDDPTADYDVYVLDAAGAVVGTAASTADPETVSVPPTTGDYTVRVVPYAASGQAYRASASMETTGTGGTGGTGGAGSGPGYDTFAAPSTFNDADNAGEPSIGDDWATGTTMYQSSLSTYSVTWDDATTPATPHWSDVSANAGTGCPQGSTVSLDPIMFTDHATGRTFESQLTGVDSFTCYTDDDGVTWHPSTGGGIPSGVDHQTIGGGPFSADGVGALPTSTYPNAVYYCSQDIATAFCAASRDGGTTFGAGVPTYSLLDCDGLHGHVKVAPDGTAYLPNKSCGANQAVVTSTDNGTTWTVNRVPGTTPSDADPSVGVGSNGTVYFGYVDGSGTPGAAVSTDRGRTWVHRQVLGQEFGIKNAVFPTAVAGDDDRAAIAYLGTPTGGNYQDAANFHGEWHLYVDTTYDGGQTWVTSDATPNDPVQVGSICTGGTACGDDRNLLDFIDVTTDDHGRVEVGFADGCIGACVSDPQHQGRDAYATIARQRDGRTLLSAFDPATTNVALSSLTVTRRPDGRFDASMQLTNTGNRALSGIRTQVLDGRKQVALTPAVDLAAGRSRTVTATWRPSGAKSHTVTAVVDPMNNLAEDDEADNKVSQTVLR